MQINVNFACENNLSDINFIENTCFSTPWSLKSLKETMKNENARFFIAKNEEGRIIGYCSILKTLDEAEILNIAVLPEFRRCGVGSIILEQVMKWCTEAAVSRLLLEVRAGNNSAVSLYKRAGFVKDGVRRGYYRYPNEDAVLMSRSFVNEGELNENSSN